jgi:hypothetical protein
MPNVFVSYRREDASGHAGRLIDRLRQQFGASNVFMDVDDVPVGGDFREALKKAVRASDVMVVVIGRHWLDARDPATGRRRLDNPDDWVRVEAAEALEKAIPVVPVYVQGAPLLLADQLPDVLKGLSSRQAAVLSDAQWDATVGDFTRRLSLLPGMPHRPDRILGRRALIVGGAATLAGLVAVAMNWNRLFQNQGSAVPIADPKSPRGLFHTHPVIGGYWYEAAFSAYVAFEAGGKLHGSYYQDTLTGMWTPIDAETVKFSAFLVEKGDGMKLQWEVPMLARIDGDTLELTWPMKGKRDYLVRKERPPAR